MTLEEARKNIGAWVVYRPHPELPAEYGEIVLVNDTYVFVRYTGDRGTKATHPSKIELLAATKES